MPPFTSPRWVGGVCAIAACLVSILYAVGAVTWSSHVALGIILALLAAAVVFLVYP